jgi:prolyl-tRNA synthetase
VLTKAENPGEVIQWCDQLKSEIEKRSFAGRPIEVEVDKRDMRGGDKIWSWVKKGVPIRLEVGPRDIAEDSVFMARRDLTPKDKKSMQRSDFIAGVSAMLEDIQAGLLKRAKAYRDENTKVLDSKDDFYDWFTPKNAERPEIHGGFALAHFCGDPQIEDQLAKDLSVTVRCIPLKGQLEACDDGEGTCIFTGKPSKQRVVFGKAY